MNQCFIGIDNGGTKTKAAVFDASGRQIAAAGEDTPQEQPHPGWCERDMDVLWEATARSVRSAMDKAGVDPARIAGVGCTGHGKGLYLWGRSDGPAAAAIASTDHRARPVVDVWQADGTAERARTLTLQPVLDCQPAALLRWLRDNRPSVYGNIKWIFEAKDYIRFRLTGEAYAEYTDYSGTSLMNLHTRDFDRTLLSLFGIGEVWDALPPLRAAADICGTVTSEAAALTGIPAGTPVCGGMFDIDACAIAMGVTDESTVGVITGTWSINECISRKPALACPSTKNSLFCLPDYYLIEESSATSAGNLDWFIDRFMGEEKARAAAAGGSVYAAVDDLVAATPSSPVVFAPFLYGHPLARETGAWFHGLTASATKAEMLRAVLEGVVFSHLWHLENLFMHREKPEALRLCGGAARSRVWVQLFADCTGLPIEIIEADEIGALGCAIAASVAAGRYADLACAARAMSRVADTVWPSCAIPGQLRDNYRRFRELLSA